MADDAWWEFIAGNSEDYKKRGMEPHGFRLVIPTTAEPELLKKAIEGHHFDTALVLAAKSGRRLGAYQIVRSVDDDGVEWAGWFATSTEWDLLKQMKEESADA